MEFHLPILFFIFFIVSLGGYADQTFSPAVYWKKVLPNTSMPKAITDSLYSEWSDDTGPKHRPFYVGVKPGPNLFHYSYAATETQLREDPNVALFFLQEDLKPGTKKTLHFPPTTGGAAFLPRHVAASIPFSTAEFSAILGRFSVAPGSEEATVMKQTIKECEQSDIVGEEKYCPTSLESMVDFTVSKLGGKDVMAVSTDAKWDDGKKKEFTVKTVKEVTSGELVACHKGRYPYAVFYCHKAKGTSAYTVELAADGKVVEAVAVCHKDTSAWNPKHLAFQVLKVKPGTVPVCHFLPEDHAVWARNKMVRVDPVQPTVVAVKRGYAYTI